MDIETKARKMKAEYYRKWRKEHPEKTKEYNLRYWENKAKKIEEGIEADKKAEA